MRTVRRRPLLALVLGLVVQLLPGVGIGQPVAGRPLLDGERTQKATPVDLVLVPEEGEWLLATVAPLVARLGDSQNSRPLLLALEDLDGESVRDTMDRFSSRSCLVVATTAEEYPDPSEDALSEDGRAVSISTFYAGGDPMLASLALAAEFWSTSESLVLADSRELAAMIIASTLATHLRVPYVTVGYGENGRLPGIVNSIAERFGASRAVLVSDSRNEAKDESTALEVIDTQTAGRRVVETLSPDRVSNVVLTRIPHRTTGAGATSWVAPFLSLLRSAPVVLISSEDALAAQEHVDEFVRSTHLRPNTVTILADYDSIGVIALRDPPLGEYCVEVEPCSGGTNNSAAGYGVGRIQARTRARATLMISRAVAREESIEGRSPSALMIANPESQFGQLPLCETISRVTAEELKNWRIRVTEFYGMPTHPAGLEKAATDADLIIFQGHIVDLPFFNVPSLFEFEESLEADDSLSGEVDGVSDSSEDSSILPGPRHGVVLDSGHLHPAPLNDALLADGLPDEALLGGASLADGLLEDVLLDDALLVHSPSVKSSLDDALLHASSLELTSEAFEAPEFTGSLDGLPLVILQSCHSLDESLAKQAFEAGAVALLGTTTNVHSASGSAFVKVFCDNLLYRGASLGEALRDTRNYFLCLGKLKSSRGHRELGKPYRAALSFRLWGDPELRFPLPSGRTPRRPGVAMGLSGTDSVFVWTPDRQLPKVETSEYLVRMFPGSVAAGIVKRLKHRPVRRVLPLYFARIDLPEGVNFLRKPPLASAEHAERSSFLMDPLSRFLYALYLPDKVCRGDYVEIPLVTEEGAGE